MTLVQMGKRNFSSAGDIKSTEASVLNESFVGKSFERGALKDCCMILLIQKVCLQELTLEGLLTRHP